MFLGRRVYFLLFFLSFNASCVVYFKKQEEVSIYRALYFPAVYDSSLSGSIASHLSSQIRFELLMDSTLRFTDLKDSDYGLHIEILESSWGSVGTAISCEKNIGKCPKTFQGNSKSDYFGVLVPESFYDYYGMDSVILIQIVHIESEKIVFQKNISTTKTDTNFDTFSSDTTVRANVKDKLVLRSLWHTDQRKIGIEKLGRKISDELKGVLTRL